MNPAAPVTTVFTATASATWPANGMRDGPSSSGQPQRITGGHLQVRRLVDGRVQHQSCADPSLPAVAPMKHIPPFKLVPRPLNDEAASLPKFQWAPPEIGTRHQLGGEPHFLQ